MEYDPDIEEDEQARAPAAYDEPVDQLHAAFRQYCDDAGPEVLAGVHVSNDAINGLPLVVDQDEEAYEELGSFISTTYNLFSRVQDGETVFSYETTTEAPISGLGEELEQDTVLINRSDVARLGATAYGEVLNDGHVTGDDTDIGALGYRSFGRTVNYGTVDGDMGFQAMGVQLNLGTVDGTIGSKGHGVFIDHGDSDGFGHGHTSEYGATRALYVDGTGADDIEDGIETGPNRVMLDLPAIDEQGDDGLLEGYLAELAGVLGQDDAGALLDGLEALDPTYVPQEDERPQDWLYDRLDADDDAAVIPALPDHLAGLEPNPAPAIAATVDAIEDDRLAHIDLDAGPQIHDSVRIEPAEGGEPVDIRSYLAWQRSRARRSDERYVPPRTPSAMLDMVGGPV